MRRAGLPLFWTGQSLKVESWIKQVLRDATLIIWRNSTTHSDSEKPREKNSISGFSQECTVTAGLRNVSRCVYTHPRGIKSSKNNEACDIFLTFKIPHATMRSTKTSRSLVISFYLEPDKALDSSNRGLCSLLAVPNNRKHGFHN